jgi:tyrosyl-tRNA synthetase
MGEEAKAFAMTFVRLITKADGSKFGKSKVEMCG